MTQKIGTGIGIDMGEVIVAAAIGMGIAMVISRPSSLQHC
jgi:hypothetical protein